MATSVIMQDSGKFFLMAFKDWIYKPFSFWLSVAYLSFRLSWILGNMANDLRPSFMQDSISFKSRSCENLNMPGIEAISLFSFFPSVRNKGKIRSLVETV